MTETKGLRSFQIDDGDRPPVPEVPAMLLARADEVIE
jgi:hypothetical protein